MASLDSEMAKLAGEPARSAPAPRQAPKTAVPAKAATPAPEQKPTPAPKTAEPAKAAEKPASEVDDSIDLVSAFGLTEKQEGFKAPEPDKESDPSKSAEATKAEAPAPVLDFATAPKAFREAHEQLKTRARDLEEKLSSLEKTNGEARKVSEEFEHLKKRNDELETVIRHVDYERSSEYTDKFRKPLETAWQTARQETGELYVTDPDGTQRHAKPEDFDAIVGLSTGDAISKAKELFGDAAWEVLGHRRKIVDLSRSAHQAIQEYRTKGADMEKSRMAEMTVRAEKLNSLFTKYSQEEAEKYPQYFGPVDSDQEANSMLENGSKLADLAFADLSQMPDEQRVRLHAAVRNRAAAFGRVALELSRAQAKVKALESELSEWRNSAPSKGEATGDKGPEPDADNLEGVLGKLSKLGV